MGFCAGGNCVFGWGGWVGCGRGGGGGGVRGPPPETFEFLDSLRLVQWEEYVLLEFVILTGVVMYH